MSCKIIYMYDIRIYIGNRSLNAQFIKMQCVLRTCAILDLFRK